MKYRKLRIAWSVAWGVLAVLLCALWVRSIWWADTFIMQVTGTQAARISAGFGTFDVEIVDLPSHGIKSQPTKLITDPVELYDENYKPYAGWKPLGFYVGPSDDFGYVAMLPYPFVVLASAALAFIPWIGYIPRRFSLRTLLVATTLVAVVLGIIVRLSRAG